MNVGSVKKIGFFSALSISFTSIVGIGIFLKNASVGANLGGNGWSWLATWIISGVIAILLAFHFGKISSIDTSNIKTTGLNSWVEEVSDKKNNWFKNIVQSNYGIFYNPILSICLSFFCAEFFISFIQCVNPNVSIDLWVYVIITICFITFFILNNYFSVKFSSFISVSTSILKFIPLLMVILIGLIFANKHNLESTSSNGFDQSISFDKAIQGIMLSIPSVLFSFDSFIGVGVWSKYIKGGEKTISKVVIVSMIFVTIVYCLICLASIFHYNSGDGGTTILNVLIDSLPPSAKNGITIFVSLFIFFSAFGTSNSICGTALNEFKNIIVNRKIIFSSYLSKKYNLEKASLFLCFIVFVFWSIAILVPSIIINNDTLIDGFSNLVVIFIFLIYAYTIFLFWKNKYLKSEKYTNERNKKTYSSLVWIAIILVLATSMLNVIYIFINGISEWNEKSNWGLFLANDGIRNLDVLILYICFSFLFILFPFVNNWILKRRLTS